MAKQRITTTAKRMQALINRVAFVPYYVKIWDAEAKAVGAHWFDYTVYDIPSSASAIAVLVGGRFANTSGYCMVLRDGVSNSDFSTQIASTTTNDFAFGIIDMRDSNWFVAKIFSAKMDVAYLFILGYYL